MEEGNVAVVCFLLLSLSFRQTVLQDIPLVDYCKFSFTKCITTGLFKKIYNISPEECVKECSSRPKCQSFNYRQRFLGCELSSEAGTEDSLTDCIGSVHSNIEEWNSEWRKHCKSLNCSLRQKCEEDKTGDGRCIYAERERQTLITVQIQNGFPTFQAKQALRQECERPEVSNTAILLGNVHDVGSRLKLQCNDGKVLIGKDITECLENGTWTEMGR